MLAILRILMGPVLLSQGKKVRRDILRMPEPDGTREGEQGDGPPLSVLLLGDSAMAGVGVPTQETALSGQLIRRLSKRSKIRWRLLAKTGWTTQDGLDALAELPRESYDTVLISLGVNDVTTEVATDRWLTRYAQIVNRLQQGHAAQQIIACALPPMDKFTALPQPLRWYLGQRAKRMDKALARWAAGSPAVTHLAFDTTLDPADMAEDGFHPGPRVYEAWAEKAAAIIPYRAVPRHFSGSPEPQISMTP
ncbi:MAG: SGNH/GDSL hydrolase family protein [Paracoccaceae bacterium]